VQRESSAENQLFKAIIAGQCEEPMGLPVICVIKPKKYGSMERIQSLDRVG
jgi:hypothetical protein